jgi:predicted enzyme related to lactoylglutathione lyase
VTERPPNSFEVERPLIVDIERGNPVPRVIHFEIPADDPGRAVKFYEKVFGWKIDKWGPIDYWLATTGPDNEPGINGAIMTKETQRTTVNTISVSSVDEYAKKIVDAGGKVLTPRTAIPGVGYFSYCVDTEGNVFGIMENDPKAS